MKQRRWRTVRPRRGLSTGLTGGAEYLGIVVAFHVTANGPQTSYGVASPVAVRSADASAATDRAVLVALYNGTGGPDWTDNTNWLTGAPVNQWHGVSTDGNGHVVAFESALERVERRDTAGVGRPR